MYVLYIQSVFIFFYGDYNFYQQNKYDLGLLLRYYNILDYNSNVYYYQNLL